MIDHHLIRTRLWSQVDKTDGCWLWIGATNASGYGLVGLRRDGKRFRYAVHRVAYEELVEPIPVHLTLDHLCHVKTCVNPAHLEVVTRAENTARVHRRREELWRLAEAVAADPSVANLAALRVFLANSGGHQEDDSGAR